MEGWVALEYKAVWFFWSVGLSDARLTELLFFLLLWNRLGIQILHSIWVGRFPDKSYAVSLGDNLDILGRKTSLWRSFRVEQQLMTIIREPRKLFFFFCKMYTCVCLKRITPFFHFSFLFLFFFGEVKAFHWRENVFMTVSEGTWKYFWFEVTN